MDNTLLLVWAIAVFSPVIADSSIEGSIIIPLKTIQIQPNLVRQQKIDDLYSLDYVKERRAIQKRPIFNVKNQYYFGEVGLGTPAQTLNILFDTGSSVLWVYSTALCCNNLTKCDGHRVYDNSRSSSYQEDGRKFYIQYVTGRTEAKFGRDDISIGKLKAKGQYFGEAYNVDEIFDTAKFDGILGLGYLTIPFNGTNIDPVFLTLVKENQLKKSAFAFYLTSYDSNKQSELILGAVDPRKYKGVFTYASLISKTNWTVAVDQFSLNTVEKNLIEFKGPFGGLVDTGSTGLALPPPVFDALIESTGAEYDDDNGIYRVKCTKVKSFTPITITISNTPFTLTAEEYILKDIDYDKRTEICSVAAIPYFNNRAILGDTFLRKYYAEFNYDDKKIGFALAV